jgi:hypothetical protein
MRKGNYANNIKHRLECLSTSFNTQYSEYDDYLRSECLIPGSNGYSLNASPGILANLNAVHAVPGENGELNTQEQQLQILAGRPSHTHRPVALDIMRRVQEQAMRDMSRREEADLINALQQATYRNPDGWDYNVTAHPNVADITLTDPTEERQDAFDRQIDNEIFRYFSRNNHIMIDGYPPEDELLFTNLSRLINPRIAEQIEQRLNELMLHSDSPSIEAFNLSTEIMRLIVQEQQEEAEAHLARAIPDGPIVDPDDPAEPSSSPYDREELERINNTLAMIRNQPNTPMITESTIPIEDPDELNNNLDHIPNYNEDEYDWWR